VFFAAGLAAHGGEACCPEGGAGAHALQVVGTNSVALGSLHGNSVTNVPFRVVNRGTNAVAIRRMIPTCSCTTGVASTNVVAPGASVVITVTLDPHTLKGDFDRGVWVVSDDSSKPYLRVMLTGTVEPLFKGVMSR